MWSRTSVYESLNFSVAPWKYCHNPVFVVNQRNLWCSSAKVVLSPQCMSVWPRSSLVGVYADFSYTGAEFDMTYVFAVFLWKIATLFVLVGSIIYLLTRHYTELFCYITEVTGLT